MDIARLVAPVWVYVFIWMLATVGIYCVLRFAPDDALPMEFKLLPPEFRFPMAGFMALFWPALLAQIVLRCMGVAPKSKD